MPDEPIIRDSQSAPRKTWNKKRGERRAMPGLLADENADKYLDAVLSGIVMELDQYRGAGRLYIP
jgi:hypothetical protein